MWIPFTGLYHIGAREYDPRTARWLQRDPIGVAGGHPNISLYCANDPVNGKDPSGLDDEGGNFWRNFLRELLKGETWTNGINTGLAATGSAFTFGWWDGGAYRNEVGFETSFLLAGVGRDCLITAGGAGAAKGISALGTAGKASQVTRFKLVSRIKENNTLVKHAEAAGKAYQKDIDKLIQSLADGNYTSGKRSNHLFGKVCEMRSNSGARVYFRREGDIIEILAKSGKGNQDEVTDILRRLYGK